MRLSSMACAHEPAADGCRGVAAPSARPRDAAARASSAFGPSRQHIAALSHMSSLHRRKCPVCPSGRGAALPPRMLELRRRTGRAQEASVGHGPRPLWSALMSPPGRRGADGGSSSSPTATHAREAGGDRKLQLHSARGRIEWERTGPLRQIRIGNHLDRAMPPKGQCGQDVAARGSPGWKARQPRLAAV